MDEEKHRIVKEEETAEERGARQFNESVAPDKAILDLTTLQAMFPQHADWLEGEAKRRHKDEECNCGNCLSVALKKKFGVLLPSDPEAYRLGWPVEDFAYPEGWGRLNREDLNSDGSGWEI